MNGAHAQPESEPNRPERNRPEVAHNGPPHHQRLPHHQRPPHDQWPPYHDRLLDYLKTEQSAVWNWFREDQRSAESYRQAVQELQKSGFMLPTEDSGPLSRVVADAAELFDLSCPVRLHQSLDESSRLVALVFVPDCIHIVFGGDARTRLSNRETLAVLLHEIAHHELLLGRQGQFATAAELVDGLVNEPDSHAVWLHTRRNLQLQTEFYCDHRAATLMNDSTSLMSALLKLHSGLQDVDDRSFAAQAAALSEDDAGTAAGDTHPELHLRARALQLPDGPERPRQWSRMIEGEWDLSTLDVLQQQVVHRTTLDVLQQFFQVDWIRTSALLGYAHRLQVDFCPADPSDSVPALPVDVARSKSLRTYFCYLLLDLATADPELEEFALAAAAVVAQQLGLDEFQQFTEGELKVGRRLLRQVFTDCVDMVDRAPAELSR